MKAAWLVRHGLPEEAFEFRDGPTPEPGAGQVRIRTEVSGLNFADVLASLGLYPDAPALPCVLGYEVVGRVEAIASGAKEVAPGDRVVAFTRFGGYASHVLADARAVVKIPDGLDAGAASALATQYCTAWYAAEEAVRLHPGDHVLVHAAAGGVGIALVQLAKRNGCTIYGTAGSPRKLEFLRQIGVDHPIDYVSTDFEEETRRLCGERGLDVVFDSIGGAVFRKGKRLLRPGGRIVSFGAAAMAGERRSLWQAVRTLAGFGLLHPLELLSKSHGVLGVNMLRLADRAPEALQRCMQEVVALASQGELKPVVGRVFQAEDVAAAHRFLGLRESIGKVALQWPG